MKKFLNALALVLLFASQAFAAAVIPSDPGATGSDIRIWGKSVSDYLQLTTVGVVTLTQPATAATITIIDNKTLTINKTLTLDGTDGTTMTFPSTSATLARTDAANTFTGVQSMTSPVLTTPVLGVAAATSINKVAITAPATSATLTILNGKTLTVNNTLTLSGTDSSTLNIGTGGTLGTAAYTATPTSASTIALWTGTCNSSSVLGGDGVCAAVSSVATSLSGTGSTVTTSQPVVNVTQTWNDGAVEFTGIKANLTSTASAGTSKLIDLQLGGATIFKITTDGALNLQGTQTVTGVHILQAAGSANQWQVLRPDQKYIGIMSDHQYVWRSVATGSWFSAGSVDTAIQRDAAGMVSVNNGTQGTTLSNYRDFKARHLIASGTAPAVTNTSANSCGTNAATLAGGDGAGKVTVGATSGTSCTVTFATAFASAPACAVNNETTANLARATSTTTTVILAGTFVGGDVLAYQCLGY